jgi:hypothetical protein
LTLFLLLLFFFGLVRFEKSHIFDDVFVSRLAVAVIVAVCCGRFLLSSFVSQRLNAPLTLLLATCHHWLLFLFSLSWFVFFLFALFFFLLAAF